jgi:hypothetical protein
VIALSRTDWCCSGYPGREYECGYNFADSSDLSGGVSLEVEAESWIRICLSADRDSTRCWTWTSTLSSSTMTGRVKYERSMKSTVRAVRIVLYVGIGVRRNSFGGGGLQEADADFRISHPTKQAQTRQTEKGIPRPRHGRQGGYLLICGGVDASNSPCV